MDSGYDVAYLSHALADLPVVLVGRLRSDRVMLRDPGPARSGPKGGRPRRHGGVLTFAKPDTWHEPDVTTAPTPPATAGPKRAWDRMHPRLTHRGPWLDLPGGTPHPARHVDPPEGRAPARRPRPETGLAVVLGTAATPRGRGPLVAGVPPQIRSRAHLPADEADPRLDRPEDPPRGHRRPVDLAHHRRPHPAPPRPTPRRGPPPPLGTPHRTPPPHPRPRPPRVSQPPREGGPSCGRTETLPAGPGRPPGSKNKHRAKRHDVGKTVKRAESIKEHKAQRG